MCLLTFGIAEGDGVGGGVGGHDEYITRSVYILTSVHKCQKGVCITEVRKCPCVIISFVEQKSCTWEGNPVEYLRTLTFLGMSPKITAAVLGIVMLAGSVLVAPLAAAQNSSSSSSSSRGSTATQTNSQGKFQNGDTTVCTQWQIDNGFCQSSLRSVIQTIINFALGFLALVATALFGKT